MYYIKYLLWFIFALVVSIIGDKKSQAQTLQRLEITQVSAPAQGVAVFRDYPDKAALIIESPVTTLRFSSNVSGIVREMHEPESGRYVLIIEPYTQILVIDAPGFIQQRQRIGNPQAREVRYFEIKPETQASNLISVIFNVTPADAKLFVDGQETEINQTVQLSPGNVEVRLEREGYRIIEDIVEISDRNILFNYRMEEIDIVPVQFLSNVEGANITIDGTMRGQIDSGGGLGLFLFPGNYTVTFNYTGYVSQSRIIEVNERGQNEFLFNLERNVGELALTVIPSDARVLLNRQDYSGQTLLQLAPGRYRLEIEREGYYSHSENVDIENNQQLMRQINLQAQTGTLRFNVTPSNAHVKLINSNENIVNEWTGIQLLRNVLVGNYTLNVTAPDHIPKIQQLRISKDETIEIVVELEAGAWFNTETIEVLNTITGRIWMDRNLGASRAATSANDDQSFGDLYQWGRASDNHEKRNSTTTSSRSRSDQPGHGSFIRVNSSPWDWRRRQNNDLWQGVNGINNPCPAGYRLPSDTEWKVEMNSWNNSNATGAFNSQLKLPLAGYRNSNNGSIGEVGSNGFYWSSSVRSFRHQDAKHLVISSIDSKISSNLRSNGYSVRCIKD